MSASQRKFLPLIIIAVTVIVLGALFWWLRSNYLSTFSERNAMFDGSQVHLPAELAGPGPIRMIHFWDPSCPCNVGNQQHLRELMDHYKPLGVKFYGVQRPDSRGHLPALLNDLEPLDYTGLGEHLPASPAVALFDRNGELAYLGPYSKDFTCTPANSFIEPALDALMAGREIRSTNTLARGCFCDWQN